MRSVLTIAGGELRRFLRERSNLFFAFAFPLLMVMVIGAQFGDGAATGRVAVVGSDSSLQRGLVDELGAENVRVTSPDWADALDQLARGRIDVAIRVDKNAASAHDAGRAVTLEVVRGSAATAQIVEQRLRSAVAAVRTERGQVLALESRDVPAEEARAVLEKARGEVSVPELAVTDVDAISEKLAGLGQYDLGASGQLLLFVFLSALTGATTLIQTRRLGVISRIMSTPVSTRQLIGGITLGRWAIAFFQGAYIMAATVLLFGVNWGNLALSLLVLLVFSLVAAGAAILLGTLLENEGAATGAGIGIGLVLAALGGSMIPMEFFPPTIRAIAHFTPHAWAYEAFAEIQRRHGTLADIAPQLGVLAAMAALLLVAGAWSLRRSLARAM